MPETSKNPPLLKNTPAQGSPLGRGNQPGTSKSKDCANIPELFKRMNMEQHHLPKSNAEIAEEHHTLKRPREETESDNNILVKTFNEIKATREETRVRFEELDNKISLMNDGREQQAEELASLRDEVAELKEEVNALKGKINIIENGERRLNIIVKGVQETDAELRGGAEQTREALLGTIGRHIEVGPSIITEARRLGRPSEDRPRIILAKLHSINDKIRIVRESKKLKGTNIYIDEDFSPAVREMRRHLFKVARDERNKGNRATVFKDKIRINGTLHEAVKQRGVFVLRPIPKPENQTPKNGVVQEDGMQR